MSLFSTFECSKVHTGIMVWQQYFNLSLLTKHYRDKVIKQIEFLLTERVYFYLLLTKSKFFKIIQLNLAPLFLMQSAIR